MSKKGKDKFERELKRIVAESERLEKEILIACAKIEAYYECVKMILGDK